MLILFHIHEIKPGFGDRYIQQYLFMGDTVVSLRVRDGYAREDDFPVPGGDRLFTARTKRLNHVYRALAERPWRVRNEVLSQSRDFVERVDLCLVEHPKQDHPGPQLKTPLHEGGPKLGDWAPDADVLLQFGIHGHLERLKQKGLVRVGTLVPVEGFARMIRKDNQN